jgi:hypothetical protein
VITISTVKPYHEAAVASGCVVLACGGAADSVGDIGVMVVLRTGVECVLLQAEA